jgi:hypothetical protein
MTITRYFSVDLREEYLGSLDAEPLLQLGSTSRPALMTAGSGLVAS